MYPEVVQVITKELNRRQGAVRLQEAEHEVGTMIDMAYAHGQMIDKLAALLGCL